MAAEKRPGFVARLVKDPANPPATMMVSGFPGESSEPEHTRLYLDLELTSWVDIPEDAVLHREEQGDEPYGSTTLWVNREAAEKLRYRQATSAAVSGGVGFAPWTAFCPPTRACPPTPFCPTQPSLCPTAICPPPTRFCPTRLLCTPVCPPTLLCPRTQFCPTVACPRTQICPTPTLICPQTQLCPIQTQLCPIQTLACPSAIDACPSALGCPGPWGEGGFTGYPGGGF